MAAPCSSSVTVNEKPWVKQFEVSFEDYSGFVRTTDIASKLIKEYEVATGSAFVVTKQTKGFGNGCKLLFFIS